MGTSYLVLWSADRINALRKHNELGATPRVLFGTKHAAAPPSQYGIETGDIIFIVMLQKGIVSIVSRVDVARIITVEGFLHSLDMTEDERALDAPSLIAKLRAERPSLGHALPSGCCAEEAVIPSSATPFRDDVPIPSHVLKAMRFRDKQGNERALEVKDGLLAKPLSIQGHYYRLTEPAAASLSRVVEEAHEGWI